MSKSLLKLVYTYHFRCGYRLYNPQMNDQENIILYGNSQNPNGMGGNFTLKLTLFGTIDPVSGMIVKPAKINDAVNEHVLSKINYKFLNKDVAEFEHIPPTIENMAVVIWDWITKKINSKNLLSITITSQEGVEVEYTGQKQEQENVFDFII
ncbi:MAG: 6-carboxytetrahydropterin synthase [Alphaproteobacteria bacterium]|nr:6-carboxytetrahydropterin synthase [Alphaproteobacteria bacterium]OJV15761.1 MAG: hypothetical protein BGO27_07590 [Alphaproteobacteria bacterium 33-17]